MRRKSYSSARGLPRTQGGLLRKGNRPTSEYDLKHEKGKKREKVGSEGSERISHTSDRDEETDSRVSEIGARKAHRCDARRLFSFREKKPFRRVSASWG